MFPSTFNGDTLGRHDERIKAVELAQREESARTSRIEEKVDGLKNWIMGTLGAAVLALAAVVVQIITAKH